jgi:hypothetical protein
MSVAGWRVALLVTLLAAANVAGAQEGKGGGEGRGRGCAPEFTVTGTQGEKRVFAAQADFFRMYPSRTIDQGEKPRPAILLDDLLKVHKAAWVNVLDCDNKNQPLPVGLPVEGPIYFVLTGRDTIKVVREVRPGQYRNLITSIRELKFRASNPGQGQAKP